MANKVDKAIHEFVESKFFKRAVESGDYEEVKAELKLFLEAYHEAVAILATRVYGKAKRSTNQIILPALREMTMDEAFLYIKNELRTMPMPSCNYYVKNR